MLRLIITFILIFISSLGCSQSSDKVKQLPHLKLTKTEYSGYANKIFYWYVSANKQSSNTPIIIWTSGGPGSSSLYGFFEENGPYRCNILNSQVHLDLMKQRDWSQFSDYIVFDQPMGIGLSFATKNQLPKTPEQGTRQYVRAINVFFSRHPELKQHPIFLAGESYGATYIALLANQLIHQKHSRLHIKGLIVVSGWIDPKLQYTAVPHYLYSHDFINSAEKNILINMSSTCLKCNNQTNNCNAICSKIETAANKMTKGIDLRNVAQFSTKAMNWKHSGWIKCLNQSSLRKDLHVLRKGNYRPMRDIWTNYDENQMNNMLPSYINLLKKYHIKMLFISGNHDGSACGIMGAQLILNKLSSGYHPKNYRWIYHNKKIGSLTRYHGIQWLRVLNAGHTVPTFQPLISDIVMHFVNQSKGLKYTSLSSK